MRDLSDINVVKSLQADMRATFSSPQGQEVMKFIEEIGSWFPNIYDSSDTNDVIARDANRRLVGTLKTLLDLSPEAIMQLAKQED